MGGGCNTVQMTRTIKDKPRRKGENLKPAERGSDTGDEKKGLKSKNSISDKKKGTRGGSSGEKR